MLPREGLLILAIILIIVGLIFGAYPIGIPNLSYALVVIGVVVFVVWIVLVVTKH